MYEALRVVARDQSKPSLCPGFMCKPYYIRYTLNMSMETSAMVVTAPAQANHLYTIGFTCKHFDALHALEATH